MHGKLCTHELTSRFVDQKNDKALPKLKHPQLICLHSYICINRGIFFENSVVVVSCFFSFFLLSFFFLTALDVLYS